MLPDAGDLATAQGRSRACGAELGDRGRRARVGGLRGPADGRAAGAAARPLRGHARTPTPRTRSSRSAPRCARRSGAIYAGANVENVAYPQGQCAEASALGALVTAGETAITARGGGGRAARAVPAVRGLPAAAGRVRGTGDARLSGPPRRRSENGDVGRAAAAVVRPRGTRAVNLGAPRVGVVLGSGLGAVADAVEDAGRRGLRGAAGLSAPDRRRARRPRGARVDRRRPGGGAPGPRASVRRRRSRGAPGAGPGVARRRGRRSWC